KSARPGGIVVLLVVAQPARILFRAAEFAGVDVEVADRANARTPQHPDPAHEIVGREDRIAAADKPQIVDRSLTVGQLEALECGNEPTLVPERKERRRSDEQLHRRCRGHRASAAQLENRPSVVADDGNPAYSLNRG